MKRLRNAFDVMLILFLGLIDAIGNPAFPDSPIPREGKYFGCWLFPSVKANYDLRQVDTSKWEGTIEAYTSDDWDPFINGVYPIAIQKMSEESYRMIISFDETQQVVVENATILKTLQGPFLVGTFDSHYLPGGPPQPFGGVMGIWLDSELENNPSVPLTTETVEIVEATNYDLRMWTSSDGLAHNDVRSIAATSDGFLWFGTINGLSRFDGFQFKNFTIESTNGELPDNNITGLEEHASGRLVICTKGNGVYFYNKGRFEPAKDNLLLKDHWVRSLQLADDGSIWFVLDKRSIVQLDANGKLLQQFDVDDALPYRWHYKNIEPLFNSIFSVDDRHVIAQMFFWGNIAINRSTFQATPVFSPIENVYDLLEKPNGWSLAATLSGLYELKSDGTVARLLIPKDDTVQFGVQNRILETASGMVWLSSLHNVYRLEVERWHEHSILKPNEQGALKKLIEDFSGNIWFYTTSYGVGRIKRKPIFPYETDPETVSHRIYGILPTDHGIWTSRTTTAEEYNRSLICFDQSPWELEYPSSMKPRPGFREYSHGGLTIGGDDDLTIFAAYNSGRHRDPEADYPAFVSLRKGKAHFTCLPEDFPVITRASSCAWSPKSGLWIAGDKSVYRYHEERWNKYNSIKGASTLGAYCVYRDKETDGIWVGYDEKGLGYFDGEFSRHYTTANGLTSDSILCVHQDERGVIWAGGYAGLNRIEDGRLTTFKDEAEFLGDYINLILEDDQENLWFATNSGIYTVPREEFKRPPGSATRELTVRRFGVTDGMPELATRSTYFPAGGKLTDGRMIVALATQGAVIFDPAAALESVKGPPSRIISVADHEESYDSMESINPPSSPGTRRILPPKASTLMRFDYGAMSYSHPEHTRFAYRLKGLSEEWVDAGSQHFAYFPNLKPDDYSFEVKAYNENLAVSPEIARYDFRIRPYLHQTKTFQIGGGCLLLAAGFVIHRRRLNNRVRIKDLERRVALNEERSRIARDMHDEIGSGLAQIRMLGELSADPSKAPEDVKRLGSTVASVAGDSSRSLREILFALNPKLDRHENLVEFLRKQTESFFSNSPIQFEVEANATSNQKREYSPGMKRQVLLITREIMTNALKHSNAEHFVMSIKELNGKLSIETRDDGKGFDPGKEDTEGRGISNIRHRVETLNGTIGLESASGQGVQYRIQIPLS